MVGDGQKMQRVLVEALFPKKEKKNTNLVRNLYLQLLTINGDI